jgi:hypothetical protein
LKMPFSYILNDFVTVSGTFEGRGRYAGISIKSIFVEDGHGIPVDLNLTKIEQNIREHYLLPRLDEMKIAKGHRELEMEREG